MMALLRIIAKIPVRSLTLPASHIQLNGLWSNLWISRRQKVAEIPRGGGGGGHSTMWLYTRRDQEKRVKRVLLPIMARDARDAFRVSKRPKSEGKKRVCLWS